MSSARDYAAAEAFLRGHDKDWAALVGPCRHDPKAAREPYEAPVRAITYQQLTAKAGDATIDRLKALAGSAFLTPGQITALDPVRLRGLRLLGCQGRDDTGYSAKRRRRFRADASRRRSD